VYYCIDVMQLVTPVEKDFLQKHRFNAPNKLEIIEMRRESLFKQDSYVTFRYELNVHQTPSDYWYTMHRGFYKFSIRVHRATRETLYTPLGGK